MRVKIIFFSFLFAIAAFVPMQVLAQQDDDVRGSFMTTRPKASANTNKTGPTARPSRRRPKTITVNVSGSTTAVPASGSSTPVATPAKTQRIGLGLTLFMRDANGLAVRTDPTREFHKGDHIRLLLETNADGYLYIFNTTDGGRPIMIYPDPELDEAGNYVQAHVPFEIPSSVAAEERLRWLTFDAHAGIEKLYFVFTREPLPAVPIEDDLITYCRDNAGKCPWHPETNLWPQIQKELDQPILTAKVDIKAKAQTSNEHRAATRGIGLNRDDPEPSLIVLTASTNKNILVTSLELIHRDPQVTGDPKDEGN
ncbi:MAG: DUF4384 domain-containing protein [Acidobacteriota bacterium]|nr:DUF4384 domain-containing protein [Acidobacteriota bacterium]